MKIKSPSEDRIIVELSAQDMQELDITYEDMDYSTSETRRVMWTLLDRAGKQLGRDIDPAKRMMIEAIPGVCGGCTVSFTILEKGCPQRSIIKPSEYLTFEFENADCLLDAAGALIYDGKTESSLYTNGVSYRLTVCGTGAAALRRTLSEFSRVIEGRGCCEFTREHWQTVSDSLALEKLTAQTDFPVQSDEAKQ